MTDRSTTGVVWRLSAGLGLATVALSLATYVALPSESTGLPEGFCTPIIAFEFAQTPADVEAILGGGEPVVRAMDLGNRIDFAFMLAYGGFLLTAALAALGRHTWPGRLAATAVVIAVVMDAWENLQLFAITAAMRAQNGYAGALALLQWATWIKWADLLLAFTCLTPWLWKESWPGRLVTLFTALAVSSALLTPLARGTAHEVLAQAVVGMFGGLWIVILWRVWTASKARARQGS